MSQAARLRAELGTRPKGLRVHQAPAPGGVPVEPVRELRVLQERAAREAQAFAAIEQAAAQLGDAAGRLPEVVAEHLRSLTEQVVELGLAVAKGVLEGALEGGLVDPVPIVEDCLRAATLGADDAEIEVAVSMADLERCVQSVARAAPGPRSGVRVRVVADRQLRRGAVRVTTAAGSVRHDLRTVLDSVAERLREEIARG